MKHFYIFLLALICLSVGLEANAQVITTLPWSDDFEGGLTKWVVESESSDDEWTVTEGNPTIYSNLKNAHSGTQNAYFFSYNYTSSLVSPVFDLSAQNDVVVSFWYSMQRNYSLKDKLTLYYRKSSSDSWSEMIDLTSEDGKWRYMQVHLTDLSANVQFKFEGYGNEGLGILLDDITVKTVDYWTDEGNYDISWYDNSGNYYLFTPAQLAGLAYLVNNETDFSDETFNLTSDIDLSGHEWVSIGNTSSGYVFDGKFNGNNHTIDNLVSSEQSFSDYYGLFGSIAGDVEIKNVTIGENSSIKAPNSKDVGGIVGFADYYAPVTITNCTNKAALCCNRHVGGIVGYSQAELTVSNCYNYGDIFADYGFVGGIIGDNEESLTVTQCGNYGGIYTMNDFAYEIGGIVGYGYGGVYDKCFNEGDIYSPHGYYVGGISGDYGYIMNCFNLGTVNGYHQVGGICGYMYSGEPIYNSFNRGRVEAFDDDAGGIVGYARGNVSVVNVYNSASVYTSTNNHHAIIGYLEGSESSSNLTGFYNNYYTGDDLSGMMGLDEEDMQDHYFANMLNSNLGMNPNSDKPWANWGIYPLTNGGFPTFAEFAEDDHYWISEGNYNIDWYNPSATTYNIGTAAELAGVAYLCDLGGVTFEGKTIKLTADIDLAGHEWVAIGNDWSPISFSGNFDGNNHKISNLYSKHQDFSELYGLIGNLYGSPTAVCIKDLTIDASCEINVPESYFVAGVVAGIQLDTFIMTNCKNYADITGYGEVGGLAGMAFYNISLDISLFKFSQCENYGNIKGDDGYVAGIIGDCYVNIEFDGCFNYGDVLSTDEYAAGIIGVTGKPCKITNCENHGKVWSNDYYVAGIVGYAADYTFIDNCTNTGDIASYDGVAYYDDFVGGIAGYISGYQSEVKNCKNTGSIIGDDGIGGIIGGTYYGGTAFEDYPGIYVFVSDCQNEGDIFADDNAAAGIVAYAASSSVWVNKCSNSGKITGYGNVGGITGYRGSVTNSYNTGDIEGYEYVGGIAGYVDGVSDAFAFVGNCYNRGDVTASYEEAGGIVGEVYSNAFVSNCYTTGEISANGNFGVVVGYIEDAATVQLTDLFYPDELANANNYGWTMSVADMKSNVLVDTLNANVNLWNANNPDVVQFETWEIRNGFNDGYPIFGFSTVSVSEVAETGSFSVYPNPAKDYVMIVNEKSINAEIRMFDMFGKLVKSFGTTSDFLIRIDVSDLTNGVYVIHMGNETAKIVKH